MQRFTGRSLNMLFFNFTLYEVQNYYKYQIRDFIKQLFELQKIINVKNVAFKANPIGNL